MALIDEAKTMRTPIAGRGLPVRFTTLSVIRTSKAAGCLRLMDFAPRSALSD